MPFLIDLRYALRLLRLRPGSSAAIVITLSPRVESWRHGVGPTDAADEQSGHGDQRDRDGELRHDHGVVQGSPVSVAINPL